MIKPQQLTLYYSPHCPFCHRVLDALRELGLTPDLASNSAGGIALKNTFSDKAAKNALKQGGGKSTVPCLRITRGEKVEWLYESRDIIAFLQAQLK
ncbi:MAG: glutaredoxin [Gammaproteobacteria bacterium]|nr:MAG: glutaredoxin [Gammaproteobacteria bacterium]